MQWWLICKVTLISFRRRIARIVAAFPLSVVLVAVGLILIGKGINASRQQLAHMLSLASQAQRFSAAVNLFSALAVATFILYYVLVSLAPNPRHTWPAIAATPTHYRALWLGANSITLIGATVGLFLMAFPLAMAFRDIPHASPAGQAVSLHPPAPVSLIALGTLLTIVQSGVLGIGVWRGGQLWSRGSFGRHLWWIAQPLLRLGLPLLLGTVIGSPLVIPGTLIPGHPGYTMGQMLVRSPATWQALLWQGIATAAVVVGVGFLLNRPPDAPRSSSHRCRFSRYGTFGGIVIQILVNTGKRFGRQPSMVLPHALLCGLVVLGAFAMGRSPIMKPTAMFLVRLVAPYLVVSIPLLSLGQDLSAEWVFRSAPLRRITYLMLTQVGATLLSATLTMMTALLSAIASGVPIPSFWYWYVLGTQTFGLSGVAFAVGGVTRIRPSDAASQILPGILFFLLAAPLQYGVERLTGYWGQVWGYGLIWIAIFFAAPLIVLGWENRLVRQTGSGNVDKTLNPKVAG